MKYADKDGRAVYYNVVNKGHGDRWIITAASGQTLRGRDGERLKSQTFKREENAMKFLEKNGYTTCLY